MLTKNFRKKRGLFLSIEMVGVIIIITAIAAVVVAGIAHLFKMYKLYQISRDISIYSEAVTQFKISFKFLPGDVPLAKVGASLTNTYLKTDLAASPFTTLPQGLISKQTGATLAFRELALAKLISYNINTSAAPALTTGCPTSGMSDLVKNNFLPTASWDDSVAWTLVSDGTTGGVTQDAKLIANWPTTKPRLVLFRYSSLTTSTDCGVDIAVASKNIGAISPNMLAEVDSKMDDGLPSAKTSIMIGENYTAGKCTDVGGTTPPADVTLATYQSSDDDSGANGCIMQVGILVDG